MDQRRTVLPNPRAAYFRERRAKTKKRQLEAAERQRNRKPENQTTAFRLFNTTFPIMLEHQYFFNASQIEDWGIRATVVDGKEIDIEMETTRQRYVHIPASELCDVFKDGARPEFVNLVDTKRCYDVVMDHLEAWVNFVTSLHMHQPHVPWEDLFALDHLAEWLFSKARNEMATCIEEDEEVFDTRKVMELHFFGRLTDDVTPENKEHGYRRNIGDEYESVIRNLSRDFIPEEFYHELF